MDNLPLLICEPLCYDLGLLVPVVVKLRLPCRYLVVGLALDGHEVIKVLHLLLEIHVLHLESFNPPVVRLNDYLGAVLAVPELGLFPLLNFIELGCFSGGDILGRGRDVLLLVNLAVVHN